MPWDVIRSLVFLAGLLAFLSWEWFAPDHGPRAPRRRRWVENLFLAILNGAVSTGLCAVCMYLAATNAVPWRWNGLGNIGVPAVRFVIEIVILDFVIYWQHRLFHAVPLFWRFHQVHHTDMDLDVTSASRFHVGEIVLSALFKLAVATSLGISVTGLALFEIVMLVAAQFQHANIALPPRLTRLLWYVVVPPDMHRVHHNPQRTLHDSNYGTILTLWDWLFGSICRSAETKRDFGLQGRNRRRSLLALLTLPLRGPNA